MLRHVLKAQSSPRGETIDRIRMYEITSQIAFLGLAPPGIRPPRVHHIPEAVRADAFGEMYRVTRPGGRLLVADFRPSGWHAGIHGMRHADTAPLGGLAEAAGFRVETTGDLPLLRYVRAVRP